MLLIAACPVCRTQFDASDYQPGDRFACTCGAQVTVPTPREHQARIVKCSNCGAALSENKAHCEFCDARLSSIDQGWSKICPQCFCRLPNDASYCVECGLKIQPQTLAALCVDLKCPRCAEPLQIRHLEAVLIFECGCCGGTWVPTPTFEAVTQQRAAAGAAKTLLAGIAASTIQRSPLTLEQQIQYVPCPTCKELMNRRNYANISGVIIDVCKRDGVWLDYQELNQIIQFLESGGMHKTRQIEAEDAAAQQRAAEKSRAHKAREKVRQKGHHVHISSPPYIKGMNGFNTVNAEPNPSAPRPQVSTTTWKGVLGSVAEFFFGEE